MNIKTILKGTKPIKKIYIRLYQGKTDVIADTGLVCLESGYNLKKDMFVDSELNIKISELRAFILKRFNQDYSNGEIISNTWLKSIILDCFGRNCEIKSSINANQSVYLTDFSKWWMDEKSNLWKVGPRKFMSSVQKSQYKKVIEQLKSFEKESGAKLTLKNITLDNLYEFVNYLEEEEYSSSTISRSLTRIKFFMNRAFEEGLKVSNVRNQRIYVDKDSSDIEKPYLTFDEINKIINKDFSFDQELDIAKQNYIILLFTGLRGSDGLKNLDISNIQDGFIKIKTSKTGQVVVLPVHDEIKKVIKQNFGSLPPKISLYNFNKAIKTIAQICEIDQEIEGKLFDPEKKRKVRGFYKKYLLLSSHSCRRGFVTLHKDIISIDAMCSLLGWSSAAMYKIYNQTSKKDYALELEKMWLNKK